ncbi:uncharacterized protein [Macrobrachium rosenbergii]|uniref:uncharacterized protein n=1 Tax=Macrobrachium rosenbergii TaxID=79674 RepID=UPI0034D5C908
MCNEEIQPDGDELGVSKHTIEELFDKIRKSSHAEKRQTTPNLREVFKEMWAPLKVGAEQICQNTSAVSSLDTEGPNPIEFVWSSIQLFLLPSIFFPPIARWLSRRFICSVELKEQSPSKSQASTLLLH